MLLSDICLTSDVCLSDVCRVYIGPNSRTERPRKTKIGTEVAHVTRDSDGDILCRQAHSLLDEQN